MKVSQLATGGTPGIDIGSVNLGRTASPDKLAVAKAIAAGESAINVTQSDTPTDPRLAKAQADIRKIKMRTNASPERFNQEVIETEASPESTTPDATEQVPGLEETKPLTPQFAALAKQRRALQVKERELADREKAMGTSSADLVARLKSQPLSVLQEHGVTYDQLTEAILSNQSNSNPELEALKAEVKALKEGVDKTFTDRDAQAEQQVLAEMQREAELIVKQGDDFEMVRETQSLPDVMDLILRTYKETGEILDVPEALRLCEEDLLTESLKIARFKKVQSRLAPPAPPLPPQSKTMRTLTNRDTASPVMDRRSRAIAAALGTLKKG